MRLGLLDIAILLGYLAIVAAIGFHVARREKKTSREYFLAGSRIPWYAIGLSMVASSISTEQFLGEVGFAYSHGMAVVNWEWLNFIALSVLIWVFTPFYIRGRIATMPEFLERRYGVVPRTIFAWLTVLSYAIVNLSLVLYGGGLALNYIFGTPIFWSAVVLAALTGAYTIYGGLSSVVWTDVFQCCLLLVGGLVIFFVGLHEVGWDAIRSSGDRAHLILPASHPELPWTAMIALALSTNIWYFCTNQYINQRCLAAKDEWHAKMGMVFCGFLGVLLGLSVAFPGLIAHAINPNIENPNQAYPFLVTKLLPPALQGIILAALVSAIMSTISSLVNSTATVFSLDIYQRLHRKDASDLQLIKAGRWCGVVTLLLGVVCVPVVGKWEHIFAYCQEVWVLIAGPTVAVFVVGVLWKRANNTAASITMALSFPLCSVPYIQKFHPFLPGPIENIFVLGLFVLVACVLIMVLISFVTTPAPAGKTQGLLWSMSMLRLPAATAAAKPHWYQRVALWWVLMVTTFILIYVILW